jgi:tetratricopeptide (TPR) repeat protein
MSVQIFLSCVSDEFGSYREELRHHLDRPGVSVKIQEDFIPYGAETLLKLDEYLRQCEAVIHLIGNRTGNPQNDGIPERPQVEALLALYQDFPDRSGLLRDDLFGLSYTQWEAWLAYYHGKNLLIAGPKSPVPGDQPLSDPAIARRQRESQQKHRTALQERGRYLEPRFTDKTDLTIELLKVLGPLLPAANPPVSPTLPRSLGRLFKGRREWLAKIRRELTSQTAGVTTATVALSGAGGIGKTRLAAEYLHLFAHEHSALLFVSAETPDELDASLAELCGVLHLPEMNSTDQEQRLKGALRWLGEPAHKGWCLLVDNVDSPEAFDSVAEKLRHIHYGRVILTGRITQWPLGVVDLHLDVLNPEDSVEFLLEATQGKRVSSSDAEDRREAGALAKELDGLALALTQGAAAINKRRLSFADYLADWHARRDELLDDADFDPRQTGYPRTVAVTWRTSYAQLPRASQVVFDALAWLAASPIPERLVTQPWSEELLARVPPEVRETVRKEPQRLLLPLYDFSLAEPPVGAQRLFSVHRLIQEVGRLWQERERQKKGRPKKDRKTKQPEPANLGRELAAELVARDFDRPDTNDNLPLNILPELRTVAPHAERLLGGAGEPISASLVARMAYGLADMEKAQGRLKVAVALAQTAVERARTIAAANREMPLRESLHRLCSCLEDVGDLVGASAAGVEQRGVCERLVAREPDNLAYQRELSIALNNVGRIREKRGRLEDALELFNRSREIKETLVAREPENLAHQRDFSIALNNVGRIRESQGRLDDALAQFDRSRVISETLVTREPENLAHQRGLSIALENVGRIREKQGRLEDALDLFDRSRVIRESLVAREPENLGHQRDLSVALNNVGRIREKQGRLDDALELFDRSRAICESLVAREPENLAHQRDLSIALDNVGRIRESQGRLEDALDLFDRSRKVRETLVAREPENLAHQRELSIALNNVGRIREEQGRLDDALELLDRSRVIRESLVEREPDNMAHQRELSIALNNVGRIREKQGRLRDALELFDRSRAICERLVAREPENLAHQRELAVACYYGGNVARRPGDFRVAQMRLHQARELLIAVREAGAGYGSLDGEIETVETAIAKLPPEFRDRPTRENAG